MQTIKSPTNDLVCYLPIDEAYACKRAMHRAMTAHINLSYALAQFVPEDPDTEEYIFYPVNPSRNEYANMQSFYIDMGKLDFSTPFHYPESSDSYCWAYVLCDAFVEYATPIIPRAMDALEEAKNELEIGIGSPLKVEWLDEALDAYLKELNKVETILRVDLSNNLDY